MATVPFTASASRQLAVCPHAFTLPWGPYQYDPAVGNEVHSIAEHYCRDGSQPASASVAAWAMWNALQPWIDANAAVHAGKGLAEATYAYNAETDEARLLGCGLGRDYSGLREGEVAGTADLVIVADDRVYVYDWKTDGSDGNAPEIDASAQLRTLSLMAARAHGVDEARHCAVVTTETRAWSQNEDTLSVFDLDMVAADLRRQLAAVGSGPQPGPHCSDCRAAAACEVTVELTNSLVAPESLVRHRLGLEIQGPDHAAWSIAAVDVVEAACVEIRRALREYADRNGGIPLADGRTWAGHDEVRLSPNLEVDGAARLVPDDAIKLSTTWAEIARVAGKERARDIRQMLAQMGAVKEATVRRYAAHGRKSRAA